MSRIVTGKEILESAYSKTGAPGEAVMPPDGHVAHVSLALGYPLFSLVCHALMFFFNSGKGSYPRDLK